MKAMDMSNVFNEKYDEVISLGFDCTIARMLESYNIRTSSYPIDWAVSRDWNLIVDAIMNNDRESFINIQMKNGFYVNQLNVEFLHHSKISEEEFKETFTKRVDRLFDLMNSDKKVLFIRKTHDTNNCAHTNKNFNEVDETAMLCEFLKTKNENFNFVLFLSCPACHSNVTYEKLGNLYLIKKKESLEQDTWGYYNKDIEDYIKQLI